MPPSTPGTLRPLGQTVSQGPSFDDSIRPEPRLAILVEGGLSGVRTFGTLLIQTSNVVSRAAVPIEEPRQVLAGPAGLSQPPKEERWGEPHLPLIADQCGLSLSANGPAPGGTFANGTGPLERGKS